MAVTFSKLGAFGRTGNSMFQIASTIGIARKNNMECYFPDWKYQKYFKRQLPKNIIPKTKITINEKQFHYGDIVLDKTGFDYDLQGYFQSERYWEHCKDEVLSYFEFNDEPYILNRRVSIHVRRGDYLGLSDYHTNLSIDYYNEAIKYFGGAYLYEVFSDDIPWCKENFKGSAFRFNEVGSEIQDLFLMSCCEHNIIANSSFSWWGAYLNKNPNKKVIAPKNWFGVKNAHVSTDDLIPKDWIRI